MTDTNDAHPSEAAIRTRGLSKVYSDKKRGTVEALRDLDLSCRPGEIFVKINKEGSTVSGLMDAVALLTSVTLQYGVPIYDLARKLKNTRFEPYGRTTNPEIPWTTSLVDYIFRWLELKFAPHAARLDASYHPLAGAGAPIPGAQTGEPTGLACPYCGAQLAYQEGCLVCRSCGYNRCG